MPNPSRIQNPTNSNISIVLPHYLVLYFPKSRRTLQRGQTFGLSVSGFQLYSHFGHFIGSLVQCCRIAVEECFLIRHIEPFLRCDDSTMILAVSAYFPCDVVDLVPFFVCVGFWMSFHVNHLSIGIVGIIYNTFGDRLVTSGINDPFIPKPPQRQTQKGTPLSLAYHRAIARCSGVAGFRL
jgi:hypothetical protein